MKTQDDELPYGDLAGRLADVAVVCLWVIHPPPYMESLIETMLLQGLKLEQEAIIF